MIRRLVSVATMTALCLSSVTPAMAQSYRMTELEAPRGATASIDFRMALGAPRQSQGAQKGPTFGLRMGVGRTMAAPTTSYDVRPTITREVRLADFRFDTGGSLARAEVATFDLANLDEDPRLALAGDDGEKDATTYYIIGGLALVAIGVLAFDLFDDDDEDDDFDDD